MRRQTAPAGVSGAGRRPARGGQRTRARVRGSIIVGVAAGAIAVSGMSAASENALPGDALYAVKRSTERAQLALASSDLSRGQLFLDFAQTRLAEAVAVQGDQAGFAAVLDDMDADTRQGIKLLTTSAAQRRDAAALDAIGNFLTGQRRQIAGLRNSATAADSDRAADSLVLLDSIGKRADLLRAALQCGAEPAARIDDLGPLPRACNTGRSSGGQQSSPQENRPNTRTTSSPRPREVVGSRGDSEQHPDPDPDDPVGARAEREEADRRHDRADGRAARRIAEPPGTSKQPVWGPDLGRGPTRTPSPVAVAPAAKGDRWGSATAAGGSGMPGGGSG